MCNFSDLIFTDQVDECKQVFSSTCFFVIVILMMIMIKKVQLSPSGGVQGSFHQNLLHPVSSHFYSGGSQGAVVSPIMAKLKIILRFARVLL